MHLQPSYQLAITTEGMIPDIVSHLSSDDLELKMQCSRAIFKCANDKVNSSRFDYCGEIRINKFEHQVDGQRFSPRIKRTRTFGGYSKRKKLSGK